MLIYECSKHLDRARSRLQRIPFFAARTAPEALKPNPEESGFSLISILAAGIVMIILGATAYGYFSTSGSKSKALLATFRSVSHAAQHFNMSLGTYPTVYGAMVSTTFEPDNTTGATLTNTWNGPYAKAKDMGANGNLHINSIATGAKITFVPLTAGSTGSVTAGLKYQYALEATGIPLNIATQTVNLCNGTQNSSSTVGEQCTVSGTGTTVDVYYVFAQNQYGAY